MAWDKLVLSYLKGGLSKTKKAVRCCQGQLDHHVFAVPRGLGVIQEPAVQMQILAALSKTLLFLMTYRNERRLRQGVMILRR